MAQTQFYFIENFDDVENTVVVALRTYFSDEIKIKEVFPKFGKVRVSETHPFAIMRVAEIQGKKEPSNLLPSVTASVVDEPAGAQLLNKESAIVEIDQEWIDEQAGNTLINQNQIALIQIALDDSVNDFLFGVQTPDRRRSSLVYAVWSENRIVKSFIYDHIRSFIHTHRELFLDFDFQEWTVDGTPSGLYNMDFGRVLYGAEVSQVGERVVNNIFIDTSWVAIKDVDFYIDKIGGSVL